MRAILVLAVVFIVLMFGMKACSGGMSALREGVLGSSAPASAAGPVVKVNSVKEESAKTGNGYTLHAEMFRGFLGIDGTLRTDKGQYRPGSLCHHGLVLKTNEREAAIRGVSGLVVVVAVDDYTRPEPVEEKPKPDRGNSMAPEREPFENVFPSASVQRVEKEVTAPPMADVPREESLKLTRQQQRQAARGVVVKGPFKAELRMGPDGQSYAVPK